MAKRSRLGVKQDAAALADSLDVSPIEGNADIKLKQNDKQTCKLHPYHDLGPVQTEQLRSALLNWFWTYGRRLPWYAILYQTHWLFLLCNNLLPAYTPLFLPLVLGAETHRHILQLQVRATPFCVNSRQR